MTPRGRKLALALLERAPIVLLLAVWLVFGLLAPRFRDPANLVNIVIQSASLGLSAIGLTFVLLTAGIDLSVGSIMFLSGVVAGKLVIAGQPLWLAAGAVMAVAMLCGSLNFLAVTRLRLLPFLVTLATLYVYRGAGLLISETRAMNLPEEVTALGTARLLGIPLPIAILAVVALLAQGVLDHTPFGRQLYAVGSNPEGARRAGLPVGLVLAGAYMASAVCAGLAGLVAIGQIGAVSPTFGQQRELAAIAAAVLGGASLFGGRGQVLPGAILGALFIQSIENGLVLVDADPYLHPLIMASVIFVAVAMDALRGASAARLRQRGGLAPANKTG